MEVRYLTVGMAQENTWIVRRDGSDTGLLIDPGDEPERIQAALDDLGVKTVEAILLTHCRRPDGEGHRSARLLPEDRGAGARGHHGLGAVARHRPVRVL